ncbi:MAG: peroxidase [Gemmatimonadetes bacterium]|nr:peroxidase [Gemmatimonadota bacterium]
MRPMFLQEIEQAPPSGAYASRLEGLRRMGAVVPQIMHLFAYKPAATDFLAQYTHQVLRGPSPLSPGLRELIAAFTSKRNDCPF